MKVPDATTPGNGSRGKLYVTDTLSQVLKLKGSREGPVDGVATWPGSCSRLLGRGRGRSRRQRGGAARNAALVPCARCPVCGALFPGERLACTASRVPWPWHLPGTGTAAARPSHAAGSHAASRWASTWKLVRRPCLRVDALASRPDPRRALVRDLGNPHEVVSTAVAAADVGFC